ncbi:MAG: hypothetical protein Q8K62_00525 [Thiobacillus sp.]|nr:hypothetical protein [Thiobacillus sp.]
MVTVFMAFSSSLRYCREDENKLAAVDIHAQIADVTLCVSKPSGFVACAFLNYRISHVVFTVEPGDQHHIPGHLLGENIGEGIGGGIIQGCRSP